MPTANVNTSPPLTDRTGQTTTSLTSSGTGFVTLHDNILSANSDVDNPAILTGLGTAPSDGDNVYVVPVPDATYLDVRAMWYAPDRATNESLATSPVVRAFGLFPQTHGPINTPDDAFASIASFKSGIWAPLLEPSTRETSLTIDTTDNSVAWDDDTAAIRISAPVTFWLEGASRVMVVVSTAAAMAGESGEFGILVGSFSG